MNIFMKTTLVGPKTHLRKGGIYEVKPKEAKKYIKKGLARELTPLEIGIEKLKKNS